MHPGLWETIADTLFWLQLVWVFSGFVLMAYLAFKVFPGAPETGLDGARQARAGALSAGPEGSKWSRGKRESMTAGNYRLEAFPSWRTAPADVIEFTRSDSEENRRLS